ncbi:MAG: malto-oligosyltrehalose synthase [Nitrospirota bacterium]
MQNDLPAPRIPVATYRVQFNRHFKFSDAGEIIPFLSDLGISDLYASPYLMAKEGSLHGYDIVNPLELNPELGSEEEYTELIKEMKKHGMGQILDIVPNHMCITSAMNTWWMDVLENGESSVYAPFFDINWQPVKKELRHKVLLPILGDQYGKVLENGEIRLFFDEGKFLVGCYDNVLPVEPGTYGMILSHDIDTLKTSLQEDDPHLMEMMSILTALEHLPAHTESDPEKIQERNREKEVIKRRLNDLCKESPEARAFVDKNLSIFNGTKDEPGSFDLLDSLLYAQAYRLSFWRVATEEINYRRFFDINDFAAIRVEEPVVFRDTHGLILELIKKGYVTGLRIDHPDGLYNPLEYFYRLQRDCFTQIRLNRIESARDLVHESVVETAREFPTLFARTDEARPEIGAMFDDILSSNPSYKPFYIVGEKILTRDERMPEEWLIFSTTGYVFLNTLNGIFVRAEHARAFDDIYSRFVKARTPFPDLVYEKKKQIMEVAMSSEINTLGHYLSILSEEDRHTRDFTLNSLISVIIEVIACFPVYRTYITPCGVSERDRHYIDIAVSRAKRRNPALSSSIFDFLADILLQRYGDSMKDADKKKRLDFAMRFQQMTGPIMAKGMEDTVFYIYNRLVSLNEVGGSPDRFGSSLETFHGKNIERIKFWPHALVATSTHDTKRSEDVRARINILSEIPDEWRKCLSLWSKLNRKKKPVIDGREVPDRNEEYLLYQTLVGVWPLERIDDTGYTAFRQRIKDYMLKAVREAKINSSWINPDALYEDGLMHFVETVLTDEPGNEFLKDLKRLHLKIAQYGMFTSLSQVLLKITSPGVPDFYQGTELWDFSLVDPDNRRPVDYGVRTEALKEIKRLENEIGPLRLCRELLNHRENGRIKLYLTYRALNHRRSMRDLFEKGEYLPLDVIEGREEHVCAFARRGGNAVGITVVPRFLTGLLSGREAFPLGRGVWQESTIVLPFEEEGTGYRNIFTGETITTVSIKGAVALLLADVFRHFPVAFLERVD